MAIAGNQVAPGIEVRRNADGSTAYRVKVRLKGRPLQTATFKRLTDAKRWRVQTEAAIREGRHFKTAEAKRHTLAEAIDRYCRDVVPSRPGNARNTVRLLAWWKAQIGHTVLADITPALLTEQRDKLQKETFKHGKAKKKRSSTTVIRYLAALSHVFTVAAKEWQWTDENPMRLVSKPKPRPGRTRFLSDDERQALLDACKASDSPYLYLIVVLALSTGMRRSELLGLRWRQIDLARKWITLDHTKNGDRRGVPLEGLALQLMQEHAKVRSLHDDFVFPSSKPNRPLDITKAWHTALRKAGVEDFRFHDLRHSAASYLAMNNASPVEIAAILGHRTLQMVKRYAHIANSHTSSVVQAMNDKIFQEQA